MTMKRTVAAANESSSDQRNSSADSFAEKVMPNNDRGFYGKWKAFGSNIEVDQESAGSSEDIESPKSVVAKVRKRPAPTAINKNVNMYVHNQVMKIKEEDSHIGEDVAEYLSTAKGNDRRYRNMDVLILSYRPILPASPLSGKATTGH